MSLRRFQNLHSEESRPHPSPPVWTNSTLALFLHPRFGLIIFLFITLQTFSPLDHGLLPTNTPKGTDLLPSIQTHTYFPLFPLAPHINHYVTSSL